MSVFSSVGKVRSNFVESVRTVGNSVARWRALSLVVTIALCLLKVTSAQVGILDIPDVVAYTGKVFFMSLTSHPVYGGPGVVLQLSASSESHDDHFPTWLHFNVTARTISGVPLTEDSGRTLLTITVKCTQKSNPTPVYAPDCIESSSVFGLNVLTFPWTRDVTSIPVLEFSPETYFLGDLDITGPSNAGCEGERVVASLVLCESVNGLDTATRLTLMTRLSSFLSIPAASITLERSKSHVLRAVENGFQVVSAGPGSEEACSLNENIELHWWLPCPTLDHLNDFIRVLQHNVDGGRLQEEISGRIMGWYLASSNSLLTRQGRRRRAAGHRTAQPTPVLSPLQPTKFTSASPVDDAPVSSQHLAPHIHPLPFKTFEHFEPSSQISSIFPSSSASRFTLSSDSLSSKLHDYRRKTLESLPPTPSTTAFMPSSSVSPYIQPSSTEVPLSSEAHSTLHHKHTSSRATSYPITQPQKEIETLKPPLTSATPVLSPKVDHPTLESSPPATLEPIPAHTTSSPPIHISHSPFKSSSSPLLPRPDSPAIQIPTIQQVPSSEFSTPAVLTSVKKDTEHQFPHLTSKFILQSSLSPVLSFESSFLVTSRIVEVIIVQPPSTESDIPAGTHSFSFSTTSDLARIVTNTLHDSPTVTEYPSLPQPTHGTSSKVTAHPSSTSLPGWETHFVSQYGELGHTGNLAPSSTHQERLLSLSHPPNMYEPSEDYNIHKFSSILISKETVSTSLVISYPSLSTSSSDIDFVASEIAKSTDHVEEEADDLIDSMEGKTRPKSITTEIASSSMLSFIPGTSDHTTMIGAVPASSVIVAAQNTSVPPIGIVVSPQTTYPSISTETSQQTTHPSISTVTSQQTTYPSISTVTSLQTTQNTSVSISLSTPAAPRRTRTRPTAATTTTTTSTTTRKPSTTTRTTTTTTSTTSRRPAVRRPTTPKERTTRKWTSRWDDYDIDEEQLNNRPYVQKSIKTIHADQGRLLELAIPQDVFYDIEDGDTRHLSLSLELPSNQALPNSFWLYLDSATQVIKGLPLHEDMDIKNVSVVLVARDAGGMEATDYITLQINDTPRRSFTHVFRMRFAIHFQQFMRNRRNITALVEKVATFFGDTGAMFMTVLEVRQGSFVLSWTNNTLTQAKCQTDVIKFLHGQMVRKDGTVRSSFSRHVGRHLQLKDVQLEPLGSCSVPLTTTTQAATTTHLVSEVINYGFSIWAHVILPVLIAVLVFILIILIIIFCNRRRRQRQAALNAEKEPMSNDCNQFLFPPEVEPEDSIPKAREPPVSSPIDSPPDQNIPPISAQAKNNLNRDQERARKYRDNREQEFLNRDNQIQDLERDRDWGRNWNRRNGKEGSSAKRQREHDRMSGVSASSTLSWDRPNNHYLEEEAGSRSSTLKSTKSTGSDKRHRKSPPPYWQPQTDPPPYRMPPPYLTNNSTQL